MLFDDTDAAISQIESRVEKRIEKKYQTASRQQQTVNALYSDYPELANTEDPLSKRADEIFRTFSEDERSNPLAMRAAVREAASEMGIKPKSKRVDTNDDSFSISGGGSGGGRPTRSRDNDLAPETLEFAERMGMDVKDPKVIERLKERAKRKNWSRYE
jgi:hypothetical protein